MVRPTFSWISVILMLFGVSGWADGAEGVRGRASLGGVLVEGVVVTAYTYRPGTFGPLTGEDAVASAVTATDGTYELPLAPGRYVVEALKKAAGNTGARPESGDLQCLYSGSPVGVAAGAWTAVGLNLVEVPPEVRTSGRPSSIAGRITRGGVPAEKVYLYVYGDSATGFRGPAQLVQPVASGAFQVRLPPGTYFLVARKRARGGTYGPIEIGDLFNFYPRNPVAVAPDEEVRLEIPLIERLSQLEEDPKAFRGVRVRVLDASGKPVPDFYVLAYPSAMRAGPPLAVSAPTGADGWTHVPVEPGTATYLRVRKSLGGPPVSGDQFADGETRGDPAGVLVLTLETVP